MLMDVLKERIEAGELKSDPTQKAVSMKLGALAEKLEGYQIPQMSGGGFLGLFSSRVSIEPSPRGLYIHGGVGRGKSMLMDLFFEHVAVEKKRRTHFHAFMLDVQARLHKLRQSENTEDPLKQVAEDLAGEHHLLCFDEFHVVNIADAMILRRLFERLFELGVVMVSTSNWPPDRLYENGLNRDRFLPFIHLLQEKNETVPLDGPTDYRLGRLRELSVYHHPLGEEATKALQSTFSALTDHAKGAADLVMVASRTLNIPLAHGGVAFLTFPDFCEQPLAAADYIALTDRYSAILLDGVPVLTANKRNEARRFMIFVDACYERKTMLFIAADAAPEDLYVAGEGTFEFGRTVSRLMEMRSADYLEQCRAEFANGDRPPFVPYALTSDLI